MLKRIQGWPQWQRIAVYIGAMSAVVVFFVLLTVFIVVQSAQNLPRTTSVAIREDRVSVREFAEIPGEQVYPAALAIGPDGTLYTGSYVTGALYALTPEGDVRDLTGTAATIGSVSGLTVADDGALYVLDRVDPLAASGAVIWRWQDGDLREIARFSAGDLLRGDDPAGVAGLPDDIATDGTYVYMSDRGPDRVWRIARAGDEAAIWWQSPEDGDAGSYAPTGLAYDASRAALLISDSVANAIYAVPVASDDPRADTAVVFSSDRETQPPGLDGLAVGPDGTIYAAALGLNRVGVVEGGQLVYLAGAFRGASDVAYDAERRRLVVTNWDQGSLLPQTFLLFAIETQPRLPFALDVVEFNDA